MTLRSPAIAALAVLFVMVGAAFILTSEAGVNTTVLSAIPTATPLPDPFAGNWQETQPDSGQYQYVGNTQNMVLLNVQYSVFDEFLAANLLPVPAEDAEAPLMEIMTTLKDDIEQSVTESGLVVAPEMAIGPQVETFGSVPMTLMRLTVPAQTSASGQQFPGAELILAWTLHEGQLARAEVQYQGVSEPMIYLDFRAWLDENAPSLVERAQELADEAAAAAEEAAGADDTADTEGDTAPEGDDAETPSEDDTSAGDADTEEPDASDAAPSDEDTEAAGDETSAAPATPEGPWLEVQEGVFMHSTQPSASISTGTMPLETIATDFGLITAEDEPLTPLGVMQAHRDSFEVQIGELGDAVDVESFTGPEETEINGVPVIADEITFTLTDETETQGQTIYFGMVPIDEDNVGLVSFRYAYEVDGADPVVFDDFDAWLNDNIADIATLPEDYVAPGDAGADETSEDAADDTGAEDTAPDDSSSAEDAEDAGDAESTEDTEASGGE